MNITVESVSPKELAAILGVSESSVKRWVDRGKLIATRTSGGHRRIPLAEVTRIIVEGGEPVENLAPPRLPHSSRAHQRCSIQSP